MSSAAGECAGPATVVFDPTLTEYDFGPEHPMSPLRVDLTMRLAEELGVLDERLRTVAGADGRRRPDRHRPRPGADRGRDPDGRAARPGRGAARARHRRQPGLRRHAPRGGARRRRERRGVPAGVDAARALHSANITGGLHHAMRDRASGFCIYNDVAVGIQWLLDQGAERVAYVDVDVHHGDGVEQIFWDDPRVLTISLHETGQMLFPGTGFPDDTGGPDAEGTAVNVALPPGTGDAGWLRAFHAVVPPLLREFAPDVLVTQHGCDSHVDDPLAAPDADRRRPAGGVPRAARPRPRGVRRALGGHRRRRLRAGRGGAAGLDPPARDRRRPPARPGAGDARRLARARPRARSARTAPARLTDGRDAGVPRLGGGLRPRTPGWTGQIHATRTAVFPLHGLDPLP